jgi:glutamyl-tRNA synthetase
VVDDMEMRISHVIRGNDHLPNTPKYILLWEALDGGDLPVFAHLPMLVDASRKKLSKRKKHKVALEDYRDDGYLPEAMVNYLALLGWSPGGDREIISLEEMIAAFRLEDVVPSAAFFDVKKLGFVNGEYLRMLSADEFAARTSAWFRMRVLDPMAAHVQTRAVTLADAMGTVDFFVSEPLRYDPDAWSKAMGPGAGELLEQMIAAYEALAEDGWTAQVLHETTAAVADDLGLKLNKAQAPVRVAVTGRSVGPPLFESMVVLGRSRTMTRLGTARDRCSSL